MRNCKHAARADQENHIFANGQERAHQYQDQHGEWRRVEPHHLKALYARGLTLATIEGAGLYTETKADKVAAILKWKSVRKSMLPALIIPYDRDYARVRFDNPRILKDKPVKYESPKGSELRIYIPPETIAHLDDPRQETAITEGELKALLMNQEGFPCIGIAGVECWGLKGEERLHPDIAKFNWQGRPAPIVFDSDITTKAQVHLAECRLAKLLQNAGAVVKCVRIPDGPNGEKQGIDDYAAAQGGQRKRKIRELLENSIDPDPVPANGMKVNAKALDPAEEAHSILAADERDGVYRTRYWRGTFVTNRRGCYHEVPPAEVRARVIALLNDNCHHLTTSITNNVMDQIKAQALLPFEFEPPCWLTTSGDSWRPPAGWNPKDLLVAKNGIIHLPSFAAEKPDYKLAATPRLFTPAALDFDFEENPAQPTTWLNFIHDNWPGDQASIDLLQEWCGYLLTADTRHQKMLLLIGPKRSGKGTIARTITNMLGKHNVCAPTLAGLATNFGLQSLIGKTVGIIGDARLSARSDQAIVTERLLSITGEDSVTIDRKHLAAITLKLLVRLMVLTNELPRLTDSSGALASRFLILCLRQSHYGKEDITLSDRLAEERTGILRWAIEGWKRLNHRGHFIQPQSGQDLRDQLDDLASPVGAFVRERCEVGPGYRVSIRDLYTEWKNWCRQYDRDPGTVHTFGRDLIAAVQVQATRVRDDGVRYRVYDGIRLIVRASQ